MLATVPVGEGIDVAVGEGVGAGVPVDVGVGIGVEEGVGAGVPPVPNWISSTGCSSMALGATPVWL